MLSNMSKILLSASCVDHKVNFLVGYFCNHSVINDTALLIGEHGERPSAIGKTDDVTNNKPLEELDSVFATKGEAAHV